jgi:hypothetical protein
MSRKYTDREQWFIDRVGKTIYRNRDGCTCFVCEQVYQQGLYLADEYHALYVSEIEGAYNIDGFPLKYFDTKEEVAEYEKTLYK